MEIKNIKNTILSNLSLKNPDIKIEQNQIANIVLIESNGHKLSLSNLLHNLEHYLELNVSFQRESTDHNAITSQEIVIDYISGQFMGNITCYKDPNNIKHLVIDGRHRLTHLSNFLKGKLILKNRIASQFWTRYIDDLLSLYSKGNIKINKLVERLLDKSKSIPNVKYTDLPEKLKQRISHECEIHVTDIEVKLKNEDGTLSDVSKEIAEDVLYKKFFRINQNSANITADDAIWGASGDYNQFSRSICNDSFFESFFQIQNNKKKNDAIRTVNRVLFTQQLFIDKSFGWNSSIKALSKKVIDFKEYKEDSDAKKEYTKILKRQIIPNFNNYFDYNEIKLPEELIGVIGKSTNMNYILYFLYKIHLLNNKNHTYSFYEDDGSGNINKPTSILLAFIDIASKIICASNATKDDIALNVLPTKRDHNIYKYNLVDLYNHDSYVFEKLDEYRKSNRKYDDIEILFDRLVDLCYYAYENGMI